jgi:hypothetical protein
MKNREMTRRINIPAQVFFRILVTVPSVPNAATNIKASEHHPEVCKTAEVESMTA